MHSFVLQDLTLQADSVGDDVYRWDVWLAGFKQGTPLEQVGDGLGPQARA
jgi:hypothetical protein